MNKAAHAASALGVSTMTAYRYASEAGSWDMAALRRVKKRRQAYYLGDQKRRDRAAQLRDKGMTWEAVGKRLGVTASCAWKLAQRSGSFA